eukprot:4178763-Prymnesium_polylepis.1
MRGCCQGRHVNFGLDVALGEISGAYSGNTSTRAGGYLPALIDALAVEMGFTYTVELDSSTNLRVRALSDGTQDRRLDAVLVIEELTFCGAEPNWACQFDYGPWSDLNST